jgi:hypothetical protein
MSQADNGGRLNNRENLPVLVGGKLGGAFRGAANSSLAQHAAGESVLGAGVGDGVEVERLADGTEPLRSWPA